MALGNRYKTAPGAGTVAALILVLVFGSPWYSDWVTKNTNPNTAGGWWLRLLTWPHWTFDSSDSLRAIIVADLKAILLVVLTLFFPVPAARLAAGSCPRHDQPALRRLGRLHLCGCPGRAADHPVPGQSIADRGVPGGRRRRDVRLVRRLDRGSGLSGRTPRYALSQSLMASLRSAGSRLDNR
jgi:hypothetical protein